MLFSVKFRVSESQINLLTFLAPALALTLVRQFIMEKLMTLQNRKTEWQGLGARSVHSRGHRLAMQYDSSRSSSTGGENILTCSDLHSKYCSASRMKLIMSENLYFSITISVFYRFFRRQKDLGKCTSLWKPVVLANGSAKHLFLISFRIRVASSGCQLWTGLIIVRNKCSVWSDSVPPHLKQLTN
jgi:hypothetical protein